MKKIMCICFSVFFVFLAAVTFVNYSYECADKPFEGMAQISVKQVGTELTNQEYVSAIENKMKEINKDIMYKTNDFSSDKTSYLIFKTNNTEKFMKGLDLGESDILTSKTECFSTKSKVEGFTVKPIKMSSMAGDVTIMDFSGIERYRLSICTYYVAQDSVYDVSNALSDMGFEVKLGNLEDGLQILPMSLCAFPLILLCLSVLFYALSKGKEHALKKLHGYTNGAILLCEIKEAFLMLAIIFIVVQLVNFGTVAIIYNGTFLSYFTYSISNMLLFLCIVILVFVLSLWIVIYNSGYHHIKGKNKKTAVFALALISKIIFICMLMISLSSGVIQLSTSYGLYKQADDIATAMDKRVATNIYKLYVDLDNTEVMADYMTRCDEFYRLTVDKFDGVFISSDNYQTSPDMVTTVAEYFGQKNIYVNENYLQLNPIHKQNGDAVTSADFDKGRINMLVSEKSGYTQDTLNALYAPYCEGYYGDAGMDVNSGINMIVYKEDEVVNSFNASTGMATLGHLDNPDIFIYDQQYMKNSIFSGMSSCYYMLQTETDSPYDELLPYLKQAGIDKLVLDTPYVSNTFADKINSYIQGFIFNCLQSLVYLLSLIIMIVFSVKTFLQNYQEDIAAQKLCGISFFRIYKKYMIIFADTVMAVSLVAMLMSFIIGIPVNLYVVCGIFIFDLIMFLVIERSMTRKNILNVLKGI